MSSVSTAPSLRPAAVAPMSSPAPAPTLRAATLADLPVVLLLLHMLHAETPHAPLDAYLLRQGAIEAITDGLVILSCVDGVPVATLALCIETPWFSRQEWIVDRWFFVHPANRRQRHAAGLLREARTLAAKKKMPLQMAVTGMGRRTAAKIRLFSRVLGQPTGAIWNVRD